MGVDSDDFFTNKKDDYKDCKIGDYTYGTPKLLWWNKNTCSIGKFCSIAYNVQIFGGGEHRTDWVTTYPFSAIKKTFSFAKDIKGHPKSKGAVNIGNDVWIARNVCIMSGVTIGDGAVIGANAVVTKNVPPYAIVAGNPAKIIKFRFSDEQIQKLLKIKWWNWSLERIEKNIHLLMSDNIDNFISKVESESDKVLVPPPPVLKLSLLYQLLMHYIKLLNCTTKLH